MTTIAQVRTGLAAVIYAGTGLRAKGYVGQQQVSAPGARILRQEYDPRLVFGEGIVRIPFSIRICTGKVADIAAEKKLDTFCEVSGSTSVIAALQDLSRWTTAGVTIHFADVTRVSEPFAVSAGGVDYLAVDIDVQVAF